MSEKDPSSISAFILENYPCCVLSQNNGSVELGVSDQLSDKEFQELLFLCDENTKIKKVPNQQINQRIVNALNTSGGQRFTVLQELTETLPVDKKDSGTDDGQVIQLVNDLISDAIYSSASDIHIEPYESVFRVRYRLDGSLKQVKTLSMTLKSPLISRLKIMAELDIAEKRRPQDGRIRMSNGERTVDIRVSSLPTDFGEKIVLRILDKSSIVFDVKKIGLCERDLDLLNKTVHLPFGMILVTGPTGSGKSTTLYSVLKELNTEDQNIVTIEDPIEYNLQGINQSHARSDIGFTFANALRAFLRQDPDVIMVGEIRDRETAEMAVRASLTGHLVLSTLHTNNAPETITRLLDMDIEPFLIAAAVKLVIAQRLVRVLCSQCKELITDIKLLSELAEKCKTSTDQSFYKAVGCQACHYTGFKGRTALFELLYLSEHIAQSIHSHISINDLSELAVKEGMKTLYQQGIDCVKNGITTLDEVLRETMS